MRTNYPSTLLRYALQSSTARLHESVRQIVPADTAVGNAFMRPA